MDIQINVRKLSIKPNDFQGIADQMRNVAAEQFAEQVRKEVGKYKCEKHLAKPLP